MKHYLVCTTPRTGSSFLCYLLEQTGLGMRPLQIVGQEYLLELRIGAHAAANWEDLDLGRFLQQAFRKTGSREGATGFKVMWGGQMQHIEERMRESRRYQGLGVDDLPRFLPEGTKYVWLVRRDRVRQAVSWARAMQTQCWSPAAQREFRGPQLFDLLQIRNKLAVIGHDDLRWKRFFERNGIRPLTIVYEEFMEAPERTVREILDYLGVPPPVGLDLSDESVAPRGDDLNEEWARRFERIESSGFARKVWHTLLAYPRWVAGSIVLARVRARAATRARRGAVARAGR